MVKKTVKGFTLVEMIIVMALFSVIMYSVVQLLDPVSKFFVRSSNYEQSNAVVDNIKRAIEGNLKYADRVSMYLGYAPDGTDDNGLYASNLQNHVANFYDTYFKDRVVTATSGTIYAMYFNNSVRNITPPITRLQDFNDGKWNRGEIVLYTFEYNNAGTKNTANSVVNGNLADYATHWYINERLYGNFDISYTLGRDFASSSAINAAITSSSNITLNPDDFAININIEEVTMDKTGTEVSGVHREHTGTETASFSMKNVLELVNGSYVVGTDSKTKFKATGITAANAKKTDFVAESYRRFVTYDPNPTVTDLDNASFYFIFTMPETTYNDDISKYLQF